MNNVIPLGNITRLELPVDMVLEAAKDKLEGAVILGFDKEGELYFASTYADGGEVILTADIFYRRDKLDTALALFSIRIPTMDHQVEEVDNTPPPAPPDDIPPPPPSP